MYLRITIVFMWIGTTRGRKKNTTSPRADRLTRRRDTVTPCVGEGRRAAGRGLCEGRGRGGAAVGTPLGKPGLVNKGNSYGKW